MIIRVGSLNPAKLNAVKKASPEGSIIRSVDVPSGVSNQPKSDEETLQGAMNRARSAFESDPEAEAGIGLEGGVMWMGDKLYLCNWGALVTASNPVLTAGGVRIPLPAPVVEGLESGQELGEVMDQYAEAEGTRYHQGAIGILSNGALTRVDMFSHVTTLLFGQLKSSSI